MGRVDSAIAGVQERDKWRGRLEALEKALEEILERRRRLELRLRRVREELSRLQRTANEFVGVRSRFPAREEGFGSIRPILR
jgi:predicted  nucleic acid-binding Zn-ribbon protein